MNKSLRIIQTFITRIFTASSVGPTSSQPLKNWAQTCLRANNSHLSESATATWAPLPATMQPALASIRTITILALLKTTLKSRAESRVPSPQTAPPKWEVDKMEPILAVTKTRKTNFLACSSTLLRKPRGLQRARDLRMTNKGPTTTISIRKEAKAFNTTSRSTKWLSKRTLRTSSSSSSAKSPRTTQICSNNSNNTNSSSNTTTIWPKTIWNKLARTKAGPPQLTLARKMAPMMDYQATSFWVPNVEKTLGRKLLFWTWTRPSCTPASSRLKTQTSFWMSK